jgi:hypothetical protein
MSLISFFLCGNRSSRDLFHDALGPRRLYRATHDVGRGTGEMAMEPHPGVFVTNTAAEDRQSDPEVPGGETTGHITTPCKELWVLAAE